MGRQRETVMKTILLGSMLATIGLPGLAMAQAAGTTVLVHQGPQPEVVAAEPHADDTFTFRLRAPAAAAVAVDLNGEQRAHYDLTKDADGVWSVTTGPVKPGVYEYGFVLGGAKVNSAVTVAPSNPPQPYEDQAVPHGSVTRHSYVTPIQPGRARAMNVYLPPEYYSQPMRRFPVVYLFAGMGEDDWTQIGRANVILDALIAQKKAVPMIIVMPNNTTASVPRPALENAAIMEKEMMTDIVPFIDRVYRTQADRDHRAIAGLSFGGGTAFTLGMRHLDAFGYVGEFGTGTFGGAERTSFAPGYVDFDPDKITPGLFGKLASPATAPKLFFMSVGEDDPRAPFQKKAYEAFVAHGGKPSFKEYPGAHEWRFFRPAFQDFAQKIFK